MSISGIAINHPGWIGKYQTPSWLVPEPYMAHDWNQGTLREGIYLDSQRLLFAGARGLWFSRDGGRHFQSDNLGLSPKPLLRKTNDICFLKSRNLLLAATDGGLFKRTTTSQRWEKIHLGLEEEECVKKILPTPSGLLIVTDSRFFLSSGTGSQFLEKLPSRPETGVEMIKLFFDVHSGKAWGMVGKLLFDLTGILLIFLSFSGLIIWFFPKLNPLKRTSSFVHKCFQFCFVHHLKWSIYFILPLMVIGLTGVFMRPPLLIVLADHLVPRSLYPGKSPDNPWYKKIKNAVWLPEENRIIVEADGLWTGSASLNGTMRTLDWDAPIFVMGTNVFDSLGNGTYLLGSFSGLLEFNSVNREIRDRLTGKHVTERSHFRPFNYRVTGYLQDPEGHEFVASYHAGLVQITADGAKEVKGRFDFPDDAGKMPLWNFLFELHNGRIFSKWLGAFSKLLVPFGSILYVILTLTGLFDWLILNSRKKKRSARNKKPAQSIINVKQDS